ncbi:hypothetical protein V1512DRAFT_256300 [Lipomyces arxii]|uniref:uncharacterized protein n=1 Tax=Lipomyces arxii TaxID=56418 RepID=UPI0034CE4930
MSQFYFGSATSFRMPVPSGVQQDQCSTPLTGPLSESPCTSVSTVSPLSPLARRLRSDLKVYSLRHQTQLQELVNHAPDNDPSKCLWTNDEIKFLLRITANDVNYNLNWNDIASLIGTHSGDECKLMYLSLRNDSSYQLETVLRLRPKTPLQPINANIQLPPPAVPYVAGSATDKNAPVTDFARFAATQHINKSDFFQKTPHRAAPTPDMTTDAAPNLHYKMDDYLSVTLQNKSLQVLSDKAALPIDVSAEAAENTCHNINDCRPVTSQTNYLQDMTDNLVPSIDIGVEYAEDAHSKIKGSAAQTLQQEVQEKFHNAQGLQGNLGVIEQYENELNTTKGNLAECGVHNQSAHTADVGFQVRTLTPPEAEVSSASYVAANDPYDNSAGPEDNGERRVRRRIKRPVRRRPEPRTKEIRRDVTSSGSVPFLKSKELTDKIVGKFDTAAKCSPVRHPSATSGLNLSADNTNKNANTIGDDLVSSEHASHDTIATLSSPSCVTDNNSTSNAAQRRPVPLDYLFNKSSLGTDPVIDQSNGMTSGVNYGLVSLDHLFDDCSASTSHSDDNIAGRGVSSGYSGQHSVGNCGERNGIDSDCSAETHSSAEMSLSDQRKKRTRTDCNNEHLSRPCSVQNMTTRAIARSVEQLAVTPFGKRSTVNCAVSKAVIAKCDSVTEAIQRTIESPAAMRRATKAIARRASKARKQQRKQEEKKLSYLRMFDDCETKQRWLLKTPREVVKTIFMLRDENNTPYVTIAQVVSDKKSGRVYTATDVELLYCLNTDTAVESQKQDDLRKNTALGRKKPFMEWEDRLLLNEKLVPNATWKRIQKHLPDRTIPELKVRLNELLFQPRSRSPGIRRGYRLHAPRTPSFRSRQIAYEWSSHDDTGSSGSEYEIYSAATEDEHSLEGKLSAPSLGIPHDMLDDSISVLSDPPSDLGGDEPFLSDGHDERCTAVANEEQQSGFDDGDNESCLSYHGHNLLLKDCIVVARPGFVAFARK